MDDGEYDKGLNVTLKDKMTPQQYSQFNKAVEACRIIENILNHWMLMRLMSRETTVSERVSQSKNTAGGSGYNRKRKRQ